MTSRLLTNLTMKLGYLLFSTHASVVTSREATNRTQRARRRGHGPTTCQNDETLCSQAAGRSDSAREAAAWQTAVPVRAVRSACLPASFIGSPINFADSLIGCPINSNSPGPNPSDGLRKAGYVEVGMVAHVDTIWKGREAEKPRRRWCSC